MLGVVLINFNEMNLLPGKESSFNSNIIAILIKSVFFNRSYLIFAFLFGYSLYILKNSLSIYGDRIANRVIHQRLLTLFCLGFIQTVFIWWGTILMLYAVYGFLIYWLLKKTSYSAQIACGTIVLLFIPCILGCLPEFSNVDFYINWLPELQVPQLQESYSNGNLISIIKLNLLAWVYDFYGISGKLNSVNDILYAIEYNCQIIGLILFGYLLSERKAIQNLGITTNIIFGIGCFLFYALVILLAKYFPIKLEFLENLTFTGFICLSIILISRSNLLNKILFPFSIVGKTAFTFYVLHMVAAYLIFYVFGHYQKFAFLQIESIAALVFCLLLIFNFYFLRYFQMGIFERLLRSFTYLGINKNFK